MKTKIIVIVSGGVVQDIRNVPENVEVEVRDYDVDDLENAEQDENGDEYVSGVW